LDHYSKRCKKNNSSRDEIHEKTASYNRTDYKTNTEIVKILNITPVLDIIWDYRRNWI